MRYDGNYATSEFVRDSQAGYIRLASQTEGEATLKYREPGHANGVGGKFCWSKSALSQELRFSW